MADTEEVSFRPVMRTFDPSLVLLFVLAALAAVFSSPAGAQVAEPLAPEAVAAEAILAPEAIVFDSEATGLRVVLPAGWSGVRAIDEVGLSGRATYRWEGVAAPFAGATVVVERSVGLNQLLQERWRRGQVASGYYGFRPTGAVAADRMVFGPGAGVEIAEGERLGRAFFVQRGEVFWSVHVSAPASVLVNAPSLLDALATGVRLSDKAVGPLQASR